MQTFVIRVWTPAAAEARQATSVRGRVEHVGSGADSAFVNAAELAEFIDTIMNSGATRDDAGAGTSRGNPHERSAWARK